MKRLKTVKGKVPQEETTDEEKFEGNGVMFKCKLFGMIDVPGARGDDICQDAMMALKQQALKSKKESKSHKQRIFLNLSVKGIRIIDEKTQKMEHGHPIHRISYISHDKDDKRTFGYIVSLKDGYKLFAFRTEKAAAVLTASLKALFQVVFQKYKDKQDTGDQSSDTGAVEEGEEIKEHDAYYAVPDKVTLVDTNRTNTTSEPQNSVDDSEQAQPAPPAVANLLDWADVNDQLEEINQGMKRSDTSELLSGVDDLNFSSAIGDDSQMADGFGDAFTRDPFFKVSDSDAPGTDHQTIRASASDSDIQQHSNPFLAVDPFTSGNRSGSISKSKSLEIFSDQRNTQVDGRRQEPDLFGVQPFANPSYQPSPNVGAMDDLFSLQPSETGFRADFMSAGNPQPQADFIAPQQACLEPAREGDSDAGDPFSLLSGDIQGMKGTLPSGKIAGGKDVPVFPQQKVKSPTQAAPLRVASGPTYRPAMATTNPFGPPAQQPFSNASTKPFPQIPPRVDLYSAQGQQGNMGPQRQPFMAQPNPTQQGPNAWGNFGGHAQQNMMGIGGRSQQGLGFHGGGMPQQTDGLFSAVNKPAFPGPQQPGRQDAFSLQGPGSTMNGGSAGMDLFGTSSMAPQQTTAPSSGKDPFGDLAGLGF